MEVFEKLKDITNEKNIYVDEPMSKHTTFKIGGNADFFVMPESIEELKKIMQIEIPKTIIGNGSNLLVRDGGVNGIVICLNKLNSYKVEGECIFADAGVSLPRLSNLALEHNLTGLEFACGIPGSLGGAIMMNAGAYGGEMSNIIESTEYLDENNKIQTVRDHKFGYRDSFFKNTGNIILSSKIKLHVGNYNEIKSKMDGNNEARRVKQPLNYPSAGSVFKRPVGYYVGKLIEDSNLKGYAVGGAQISPLHAGFIINTGNATARDVLTLISYIQNVVKDKFNVELESEIRVIGED